MATRTIPISEFKAHLLRIASEVEATGDEIIVTRRGKPVLKVAPAVERIDLRGSLILPDDLSELDTAFDDIDPDWGIRNDPLFGDTATAERGGPYLLTTPTPAADDSGH